MLADVPPEGAWRWEATAAQRSLVEHDSTGARLLRESGPLVRLRVAQGGPLAFTAALAHADLDYEGRTQAGDPLSTRSRHVEAEAGVRWRPLAAGRWGGPALTFDALWLRRRIAATDSVSGLEERSTLWMPGIAWTTPAVALGRAHLSFDAQWRWSVQHRLAVDYAGLFDPSTLRGGRRNEVVLRAKAAVNSGWSLALQWQAARQRESEFVPIYRGGAASGTVRQPRIEIDDVGLVLSKSF